MVYDDSDTEILRLWDPNQQARAREGAVAAGAAARIARAPAARPRGAGSPCTGANCAQPCTRATQRPRAP